MWVRLDDAGEFFKQENKIQVLLTRKAAKEVIQRAGSEGLAILRYEGGKYQDGKFIASLSAIWDRLRSHTGREFLEIGNLRALKALEEEPQEYDAFIISVASAESVGPA